MRRSSVGIVILLIAALVLGIWIYPHSDYFQTPPYTQDKPLSYLSRAAAGHNENLIVIADSRQEIIRMNGSGVLEQQIRPGSSESPRHDFTEVAESGDGTIFVLDTVLDEYGLYVQEERIVKYEPGDVEGRQIFAIAGSGINKRVGQIKGLQTDDSYLYLYYEQEDDLIMQRVPLAGGQPEELLRFELPPDRYLSEVVGYKPDQIYYSTKRGAIYRLMTDGSSEMIYPLASMEQTRRNFPEALQLHENGRLYFIDRLLNAVMSMKASDSTDLRVELTESELGARSGEAEFLEIMDIALDASGSMDIILDDRIIRNALSASENSVITNLDFSRTKVVERWLTWLAAVALVIVLVVLIRLFYVHALNRRISLFLKQVFAIVPILVLAMVLLSNFIYDSFSSRMEEDMKSQLVLLARNGQNMIDGDQLNRMTSPDNYRNDDYLELERKMNFLYESESAANRRGLYSSLYKYEGGEIFVIMDEDDGVNMFKPFAINDENIRVVEQGTIESGFWEDATGKWIYAIGPLYDSAGNIVGVYETGRDLNVLYQSNVTIYESIMRNIGLISVAMIVIVLAVTYWLLSSLRKLRKSVMEMANGNWDVKVNIRAKDEVGDLGEQFNRMAYHIRNYIKDITTFSEASHRFVPQQIFKYLGKKGISEVHLGDQVQQNMAVMVTNIRSFNQLSKQLTPKQNFDFMNAFLKRFSPFVRKEDGLVSKYLGAGFMALFPGRAEEAIRAAIAIRRELDSFNDSLRTTDIGAVDMGIAIHKGPLMLGIVGEEQRMEGNVISDVVNLATTLERMSNTLGASVLVTRVYFDQLRAPERIRHRHLGRVRIDGKDEPIELIDVYEGDSDAVRQLKDRTKEMFERGIILCQEGRFFDARETFIEVIKINRMDKAAKLYFYLCDEYYQKGSAEGWNGTLAV